MAAAAWTVRDKRNYHIGAAGESATSLPSGIFKLVGDPKTGELYLRRIQDAFPLPSKIYDMDAETIHQVTTYYRSPLMVKNLGVLLSGVKGSGKTITAKQLCNTLGLPVILISAAYNGLSSFINDICQDVLIFVDEYEKVFADQESMLLTLMDGAFDNGFKRVFLLTVNEMRVSSNLIERPGRIRYHKRYVDMTAEAIQLVLDDMLTASSLYDETFQFITELKTITIDIVKSVIDEVNLFRVSPFTFAHLFNIDFAIPCHSIYDITDPDNRMLAETGIYGVQTPFTTDSIGGSLRVMDNSYYIRRIVNSSTLSVSDSTRANERTFEYVVQRRVHKSFAPLKRSLPDAEPATKLCKTAE